jgi:hypothetical protein
MYLLIYPNNHSRTEKELMLMKENVKNFYKDMEESSNNNNQGSREVLNIILKSVEENPAILDLPTKFFVTEKCKNLITTDFPNISDFNLRLVFKSILELALAIYDVKTKSSFEIM